MFSKLIPWKRHNESSAPSMGLRGGDDVLASLRREFDATLARLWDDWNQRGSLGWDQSNLLASTVDFDESENEYVMTAELPGFEPDDIDVKVSGNVLTVKAEHKQESDGKHGRLRRYGSFYESFTLPVDAQCEGIDARYHSGVLEVHVPKDRSTPSKRVEVKSA